MNNVNPKPSRGHRSSPSNSRNHISPNIHYSDIKFLSVPNPNILVPARGTKDSLEPRPSNIRIPAFAQLQLPPSSDFVATCDGQDVIVANCHAVTPLRRALAERFISRNPPPANDLIDESGIQRTRSHGLSCRPHYRPLRTAHGVEDPGNLL